MPHRAIETSERLIPEILQFIGRIFCEVSVDSFAGDAAEAIRADFRGGTKCEFRDIPCFVESFLIIFDSTKYISLIGFCHNLFPCSFQSRHIG
jgi:hypothetical protein